MQSNFKLLQFIVKPSQCILSGDNGEQMLEPKTMSLLIELAKANNQLISRVELFQLIWGEQVVTDYALNTLIASLRKSLGDQADKPQFIETRPKLGYRLIPKVEWIENSSNDLQENIFLDSNNRLDTNSTIKVDDKPNKLINWSLLAVTTLLFVMVILVYKNTPFENDFNSGLKDAEIKGIPNSIQKTKPQYEEVLQYKYISKVHISVDYSELNKASVPICINTDADFVAKLVFSNNRWSLKDYKWTLYSDFYDVDFRHSNKNLAGLNEKHIIEHGHPYGKVIENMSITFDESEDFTGTSAWKVLSFEGKELCHGNAIFIANRL
ncbi:MAG: hypothetical protein COA86_04250 [Kangiella sp.]|nr:MAG: hypothetical protein COA86_04250 [Kangiella sp.]